MKMTIKKKLIAGFGILLLLFVIFGIVVLSDMGDVQEQFSFVVEHGQPALANANRLLKLVVDMETGQRGFCITQKEEFLEPYNNAHGKFSKLLETEKALVSDNPSQIKTLERIDGLVGQWQEQAAIPEIAKARKIATCGKDTNGHHECLRDVAALLEAGTGKDLIDKVRAEFNSFIKMEEELTAQRYAAARQTTLHTKNITLLLVVFSVIFGTTVAVLSIRTIISSIGKLLNGTKIIGAGDLTHRIEIKSKDEIGELAVAFNQMVDNRQQIECKFHAANQQLQVSQKQVENTNRQLQDNIEELERFNRLMIGREGRIIEIKKEVNALLAKSGKEPQYKSVLEGEDSETISTGNSL